MLFKKPEFRTGLVLFHTFSALSLSVVLLGLAFLLTDQAPEAWLVGVVVSFCWFFSFHEAINSAYHKGMADMVINDPVPKYEDTYRRR